MRKPRTIFVSLASAAIATAGLFSIATPAQAFLGHKYLHTLTGSIEENPEQAGVDAQGNAYVAGKGRAGDFVQKFGPTGAPAAFSASQEPYIQGSLLVGVPSGAFTARGVAVDQSTGDLYVSFGSVKGSQKGLAMFDGAGEFQFEVDATPVSAPVPGPIGAPAAVAVDQATHEVFVIDNKPNGEERSVVDVFSAPGAYLSQLVLPSGIGAHAVAIDDTSGKIYLNANGEIFVYSHMGILEETWTGANTPSGYLQLAGVAVDQSSHNVYTSDSRVTIYELSASGEYLSALKGAEGHSFTNPHPDVDPATGDLYVSASVTSQNVQGVDVFGPDVLLPDATTGPAEKVAAKNATLTGTTNPDGVLISQCQFKYGLAESYILGETYEFSAPCSPAPGEGSGPVALATVVGNLRPNSTYHYQLGATNANGSNFGRDATFVTPPTKPEVVAESTPVIGSREALLEAVVNPEHSDTSYRFVYGPTNGYGQSIPVTNLDLGSAYGDVHVEKSLVGLQAGATYHYAVIATNQSGTVFGPDQTFTATAPALPSVTTGGVIALSQNDAVISGTIDPAGTQTSYEFDLGNDTAYGTRVFGNAGSGAGVETFTASFQSLEPGTTYHYRLVATSTYGTTYGADQSFTTPGFPTALLTSPGTTPLLAVPQIRFPTTTVGVATPKAKAKAKAKHRKRRKTSRKKGKKARKSSGRAGKGNGTRASRSSVEGGN